VAAKRSHDAVRLAARIRRNDHLRKGPSDHEQRERIEAPAKSDDDLMSMERPPSINVPSVRSLRALIAQWRVLISIRGFAVAAGSVARMPSERAHRLEAAAPEAKTQTGGADP
jgi:hypothetical protein